MTSAQMLDGYREALETCTEFTIELREGADVSYRTSMRGRMLETFKSALLRLDERQELLDALWQPLPAPPVEETR